MAYLRMRHTHAQLAAALAIGTTTVYPHVNEAVEFLAGAIRAVSTKTFMIRDDRLLMTDRIAADRMRAWATSLMFVAVVMTLSTVPRPSQIGNTQARWRRLERGRPLAELKPNLSFSVSSCRAMSL
ncbi:hypothetical protein [Streptomyces sp. NPDC048489]|uniref:hypothetical protein n=1 Tax=Streptomyces sp. NPDC048489 TaxID=3154504 RepID=UPI003413CB2E